jgi:AcrR family transcriptional regulator
MAKKSYQERVRERREQDILKAASHLIHQHGYNNFSMDGLADAVGISKSTLYQHFSSKEAMVRRVVLKGFMLLHDYMHDMDDSNDTPIDRLEALLRYLLRSAHAPDGFATTLVRDEVMTLFRNHPDVRRHTQQAYTHLNQWVDSARDSGQIRADLANAVVVSTMFGMITVLNSPDDILDDPLPPETVIEQAVSIWRQGVTPRNPTA